MSNTTYPDTRDTAALDEERIKANGWLFIRRLMCQGHAQEADYRGGKYGNYEEFMARVDVAAHERMSELYELCGFSTPATTRHE